MILRKLFAFIVLCSFLFPAFSQRTIAIKCGKLFNAETGQLVASQLIIVQENLIQYAGDPASFKGKIDTTIDLSVSLGTKLTLVTCDTLTGKSARFVLTADFVGTIGN